MDVNDCATLSLAADESDYCDANYDDYQPTDACAPPTPQGRTVQNDSPGESPGTNSNPSSPFTGCEINAVEAKRALQIWAGIRVATDEDMDALDYNADEVIDWADIVTLMREPCRPNPRGWYTLQGNRRHTGRSPFPVRSAVEASWTAPFQVGYLPSHTPPGLLAVPDGSNTIVYACTTDPNGNGAAVYRVQDNGGLTPALAPSNTQTHPNPRVLPTNPQTNGEPYSFDPSGTPLLYNGKLFVPGEHNGDSNGPLEGILYVLNADDLTIEHVVHFGSGTNLRSSPIPNPVSVGVIVRVHTANGNRLYCLSADDATQQWSSPTAIPDLRTYDSYFVSSTPTSPCVYGGKVYAGTGTGDIHTRSLVTGESDAADLTFTEVNYDAAIVGSIAAFHGAIFAPAIDDSGGGTSGYLANISLQFNSDPVGSARWLSTDLDGQVRTTPAINSDYSATSGTASTKGCILMATDSGTLYSFWADKVSIEYEPHLVQAQSVQSPQLARLRCSPVVVGPLGSAPRAFIGTEEGYVYMFDDAGTLSNPTVLKDGGGQDLQLTGAIEAPLAVCAGPDGYARIYALSTEGELVGFH